MSSEQREESNLAAISDDRRGFLGKASATVMAGGLAAGYGMFAIQAGRFLFPAGRGSAAWQFVATLDQLAVGESMPFETPAGATVVIARQGEGNSAEDFIALSSVCPHLGCQVHWESQNERFFCPCHKPSSLSRPTITVRPITSHWHIP